MKFSETAYIDFDPYVDDSDVKLRKVRILKTRKDHQCFDPSRGEFHDIPKGTIVRFETAIVDGEWQRYYTCIDCIDRYLEEDEAG